MSAANEDVNAAIEELTGRFLGRLGVIGVSDEEEDGKPIAVLLVAGDASPLLDEVPHEVHGVRVCVRPSGRIVPY